jgi:hypothetical protein
MLLHDGVRLEGICGMEPSVQDGVQEKAVGMLQGIALKGLVVAQAHPIWTGALAAALGMLVVYTLRRALKATIKWLLWDIPTTTLGVAFKPIRLLYRKVRGRTPAGNCVARLPLIGETAFIGPCRGCGTRREYRIRVSAYSGGALRGYDTISGATVLGCADCTKA